MVTAYAIVKARPGCKKGYRARGGALQLWNCKDHEVIISGPAETGKTYGCLYKLNALLWRHAGSQAAVIRKTLASLYPSVLQTYRIVLGPDTPVKFYGGEKPEWAEYPNGSRVHFAGMDNPTKALSSERDFVYVNQAEELALDDWEVLTTRCTGRAAHAPYPQLLADCNPGAPSHWIRHRPSLTFLESRHEDNPTLFDDDGNITERGVRTLSVLDRLTGARKQRLRYGRWVQSEGVVYEGWDVAVHVIPRSAVPACRRHVVGVDWGYTNPGCLQVWAVDGDGRMSLVREYYRTQELIGWWVERAREVMAEFSPEAFVCDPAEPVFLQEFASAGLPAVPAMNAIAPGIQAVAARLARAADGRPRLVVAADALAMRDEALAAAKLPVGLVDEMDLYAWPKGQDGKSLKEVPVDRDNHAADAMRYACTYLDLTPRPGAGANAPRSFAAASYGGGGMALGRPPIARRW